MHTLIAVPQSSLYCSPYLCLASTSEASPNPQRWRALDPIGLSGTAAASRRQRSVSSARAAPTPLVDHFTGKIILNLIVFCPEIHKKRQATRHDCLPSLLGDGDKAIEIVYGEEKIFFSGPTRAAKAEQKFFVPARRTQQTNHGPLSFVLFGSRFASVSIVSREYPSLAPERQHLDRNMHI
jgi:hypothetical protein